MNTLVMTPAEQRIAELLQNSPIEVQPMVFLDADGPRIVAYLDDDWRGDAHHALAAQSIEAKFISRAVISGRWCVIAHN